MTTNATVAPRRIWGSSDSMKSMGVLVFIKSYLLKNKKWDNGLEENKTRSVLGYPVYIIGFGNGSG